MLSEHQYEGWLESYLLTGRHGFFSCYEAFIHLVDSMFNQHAKWLKTTRAADHRTVCPRSPEFHLIPNAQNTRIPHCGWPHFLIQFAWGGARWRCSSRVF
jgi:xylulose-5-phosphate/fructose-6-phosphate phosphoketolase